LNDIITLDERYSTTRRVRQEDPVVIAAELKAAQKPEDQFETVVFLPEGEGRQGEGGLRTQGYFKRSEPEKPLITIVTVVFNGEKYLEETILSVINQTYDNVEYIIVDGGSTDGTRDIIQKYEHAIDYWVSEKDGGIYDAMNKGIDLASGEWINFMNTGDGFYSDKVLEIVFLDSDFVLYDIVYGNHQVIYPSGRIRLVKAGLIKNLSKGSQFCHQASFVKNIYHKAHKFNSRTKIVADFEFFYNAWKHNAKFKGVDLTVAKFEAGGVSDVHRIDSILGRWVIVDKRLITNIFYIYAICKELLKSQVKRIV
jgi:glycosyltransferase involved in cell wall biosynthesis